MNDHIETSSNATKNKTKIDDKCDCVIIKNDGTSYDNNLITNYRKNKSGKYDRSIDSNIEKSLSTDQNKNPIVENNIVGIERMREVEVDEFLEQVGAFGVSQKLVLLFLYLVLIPHTIHMFSWTFNGQSPAWKCTLKSEECNVTRVFDLGDKMYESRCEMERNSWQFVEEHDFSIVTEWDLVCNKKEYPFIFNSIMWIGWAFGAFVFGYLSDRYGRKKILFTSLTLMLTCSLTCAFVPWLWAYVALVFIVGFAQGGVALTSYILCSELMTPKFKSLTSGAGTGFMYTISLCLLSVQAWVVKKRGLLMLTTTAPYFLLLLCYKIFPESVRWLRLNGHIREAESILRRYCKINKKEWPTNKTLSRPVVLEEEEYTLKSLFKEKTVVFCMVILMFVWFAIAQVYFGISMASDQLSGNIYRDFALTSLVGIPANMLVLTNRFGRKPTLMASLAYVWTRLFFGMIGQMGMSLSFSTIYTWSMELMPTSVRSQGMGILSVVARFGGSSAPWVAQWLEYVHWMFPFAVMSAFALFRSLACARLPETKEVPTIETIQQLKRLVKRSAHKEIKIPVNDVALD